VPHGPKPSEGLQVFAVGEKVAYLRTHGNQSVAFAVQDVRAAVDELRRRGADIVFVKDFDFAGGVFIRDNAGNLTELMQEPNLWRQK